jgi:hypothetical protein
VTLAEIELDIFRRLDYADAPPPSVKSRIDSYINQRYAQILSQDRLRSLRRAAQPVTQPANTPTITLVTPLARVTRVLDQDNDLELVAHTYEWYREHFPDPTTVSGTPYAWAPYVTVPEGALEVILAPTPGGEMQYIVEGEALLVPLVGPDDVPLLPVDFHDLLCMYGRLDEYEFKSDDRWQTLMAQVQARLRELRAFVENHDVYKRSALPDRRSSRSRLDPWFRAGA